MAALDWFKMPSWLTKHDHPGLVDSDRARDLVREAYRQSGGPTPDLWRVYNSYIANERKREKEQQSAQG